VQDGPVNLEILPVDALNHPARAEIIDLCESAYAEDFAHLFEQLPGSVHILARDERGLLVSHAAWVPRWLQPAGQPLLRTAYIEAVATVPDRQRQGFATTVLGRLGEILRADPTWELAALSPSEHAFYTRLGWELWRGPLAIRRGESLEATPPEEEVMILRLPRTPSTLETTSLLTAEWRVGELW
jgi:aminoglycoside 2'-N-acetyltransferase I